MDKKTFTSLIEEKLRLTTVPEVIQEIVLHDFTVLILKRIYIDSVSILSEEDAVRYDEAITSGDYEALHELLIGQEHIEEIVLRSTEEILSEFTRAIGEGA